MQCLTDEHIQLLIDGEMAGQMATACEKHLAHCPVCQQRYEERSDLALSVSELINLSAQMPEQIPAFVFPENNTPAKHRIGKVSLWLKIVAVLIPAIVCWQFWPEKPVQKYQPTPEAMMNYELCNSVDANTAWQENMIITTVTDENGKVIECTSK